MDGSDKRRQARRQPRGLVRVAEILSAAGELFATAGYDRTTVNMIAARATTSSGSLYQFFPNKEAITQAYATAATGQLHEVYHTILVPEIIGLPLDELLDVFVDALVAFNLEFPGYFAISLATTISPPLASELASLRQGIASRMDTLFTALRPASRPEQRRVAGLVSYRLFLALLPLILGSEEEDQRALIREMKLILYRYWKPEIDSESDAAGSGNR